MFRLALLLGVLGISTAFVLPRTPALPTWPTWFRPEPQIPTGQSALADQFIDTAIDHFGSAGTFKQRYWSNNQWYRSGGPVFVVVGGGLSADPYWISNATSEWCSLAATHGAWLYMVEHRYYGQSRPRDYERTADDFAYLNAKQSTEDFADFIKTMKQQNSQLTNAKWAVFGAAYAGNLALWTRTRHPELVSFAVASSPPLQAKYDFSEMLEGVQEALEGYSALCASSSSQGFNQITQLLQTAAGRNTLKNIFNLCDDLDASNVDQIRFFWSTILNPYISIVLYGGDNYSVYRSKLTLQNAICRFQENPNASPMAKMQAVWQYWSNAFGFGGFCTEVDYNGFVGYIANSTDTYSDETRAWIWQQCTELGFMQTTDSPTAGPFFGGNNLPLDYYTGLCQTVYGQQYGQTKGQQGVDTLNKYFGGSANYNTSYTIIINGGVDPWRKLSVLTSQQNSIVPVVTAGMGHWADLYPWDVSDPAALKTTRSTVSDTIKAWLKL